MKAITIAFLAFFILFITSCSDFEQSTSPITPDADQIFKTNEVVNGTYNYLQCFRFVPVASINSSQLINSIEIVISPDNFPKSFLHMFVAIEYNDYALPLKDQLIFVGKPGTNVIILNNVSYNKIKSVKVYAYIPGVDSKGIVQPYNYLTKFNELEIAQWGVQGGEIQIVTEDWQPNLSDTFVQFELKIPDNNNPEYILTYISRPQTGKIILPKFLKESIKDVKMFGHFHELILE